MKTVKIIKAELQIPPNAKETKIIKTELQIPLNAITIVLYIFFNSYICYAGNDNYPLGARSAGMATASVTMTDVWASANNQAGLGYIEQPVASFFYENRMNVSALALHAAAIVIPVNSTVIGVNYRYFGYEKYNESKFGLAVGKRLGEKIAMGVQMDYFHAHFAGDYGDIGVLCGEIGLMYELVENLTVGMHLFNLWQSKQKVNYNERVPTIMRFGFGYKIQDKATVTVETEKDLRLDAIFKGGFEYNISGDLFLRCGVSNGNMYRHALGLGYAWKRLTLDVSFSNHKYLGYMPHISLIVKNN